jgi:hypothetical protein
LEKFVKLEHKVLGAKWHDVQSVWEVEIEYDGKIIKDWCNILMNGSGLLNRWKCKNNVDTRSNRLLRF